MEFKHARKRIREIMKTNLLSTDTELDSMRALVAAIGTMSTTTDFEEMIQMESTRKITRLWWSGSSLAAFAYVDDYNNLWFDADPHLYSETLGGKIVAWGADCIRQRNVLTGEDNSLDYCILSTNIERIRCVEVNGFVRQSTRSLNFSLPLVEPIAAYSLPPGFLCRSAGGEEEVEALVALHRAAFQTDNMTVERRLAIMHAPNYVVDLDLVVADAEGKLAAFCVCDIQRDELKGIGYTEPIGTHPDYQHRGLGKAVLAAALNALRERGCQAARFGTSSENTAMQHLGLSLGFTLDKEKLWFSKAV
jgi:mycothiol synthase